LDINAPSNESISKFISFICFVEFKISVSTSFNFSDTLSFSSLIFVSAFTVPTYSNPLNVNVNTVPITNNFFFKSILHFFFSIFFFSLYQNSLYINYNTVLFTTIFFLKSILHFFSLIFYGHTTQLIISIALITTSSYYKNMTF